MKILHIITCLDTGGANMMLYKLVSCMNRIAYEIEVISLMDVGPIGDKIQALGIPVRMIGMRRGVPNPLAILRLAQLLQQDRPSVIQTWTYHADIIGGLAAKLAGNIPVAWGVHHSTFEPQSLKRMTMATVQACARLSHWLPDQIVCCSEASWHSHLKLGYAAKKMVVITNGFDLTTFKPDSTARLAVRRELGLSAETPLVGLVARFDPFKDHRNFIQAAAKIHSYMPECHFVLCGDDITWRNADLVGWIEAGGIRSQCHLLGRREDISRLTAAFDIATTASSGEAFPMVIGEAMACGVPCVVTDVGDSANIVGETGVVVRRKDSQSLADGWAKLLLGMSREERQRMGFAARQRITEKYSLEKITNQYERLYDSLMIKDNQLRFPQVTDRGR